MIAAAERPNHGNFSQNDPQVPYTIRSPRYQTMQARIASFDNFPRHINISHQQLAVSGLFFTGKGDLCRCFTCDGGLKDWSSGDDPVEEHATYFSKCPYIIKIKGEEYVKMHQNNRARNELVGATSGNNEVLQPAQSVPNVQFEKLSVVDTNTEYSSFNVTQVVQHLGYSQTDVITAKAELQTKGKIKPTVEEVVNTILDMQERNDKQPQAAALQREKNDGETDILFLPCNHHRVCQECSKDLVFCPVCNEFIKEKVKTFRA